MVEKLKIGITHGDINGIGYEIILKLLVDYGINELFIPVIYGSSKVAAYYRKLLNMEGSGLNFNIIGSPDDANPKRANLKNVISDNIKVEAGIPTVESGKSSLQALEAAVGDLKQGKLDALVTCPVSKSNTFSENHAFPGHTEYLAKQFDCDKYMMLMVNESIKIGFVTGHIPVDQIAKSITKSLIVEKLQIMKRSMTYDFGIRAPRIAVLALNPHCGDNGVTGNEEKTIIRPAIDQARDCGMLAFGPYPADGFFATDMFSKFDAVLAMYHDQGMIPFKSIQTGHGVNFTAGLPIVRTSPAHGTAFDIAGKGEASHVSLREAIFLACDVRRCRDVREETGNNSLGKQDFTSY